jgi:hypothetical protein
MSERAPPLSGAPPRQAAYTPISLDHAAKIVDGDVARRAAAERRRLRFADAFARHFEPALCVRM